MNRRFSKMTTPLFNMQPELRGAFLSLEKALVSFMPAVTGSHPHPMASKVACILIMMSAALKLTLCISVASQSHVSCFPIVPINIESQLIHSSYSYFLIRNSSRAAGGYCG